MANDNLQQSALNKALSKATSISSVSPMEKLIEDPSGLLPMGGMITPKGINPIGISHMLKALGIPFLEETASPAIKRVAPKMSESMKRTIGNDVRMDELLRKFGGWGK